MKKETLQSELFRRGLIENGDPLAIEKFKKERHRKNAKAYNKEYLKDKKSKSLVFSQKEYEKIVELAQKYEMPEATFLKACIFGYINSVYISPDKETIMSISNHLLDIKNAVLQSVSLLHMRQDVNYTDLQAITQQIADLEFFITNTLKNPPRLSTWLQKHVEQDEQFLSNLLRTISDHLLYD